MFAFISLVSVCFPNRRSDPRYNWQQDGYLPHSLRPSRSASLHPQDHHPSEDYVEEFFDLVYLVAWNDGALNTLFWTGLEDALFRQVPATATTCSLARYIDYVLWLSGSSITVSEVDEDAISGHSGSLSWVLITHLHLIYTLTTSAI